MHIVALKSPDSRDHRSVIHPDTVKKIIDLPGVTVSFESGIGNGINISDQTFIELGLKAISRDECLSQGSFIITPSSLTIEESNKIQKSSTVLGMLNPFYAVDELKALNQSRINVVSMEFIPRITRAQKMDVLSSQANLAGYAAVLEAAQHLSSALPMMMTAAGTLKPARVFVIGVGVAGLQAIATAKRMGAIVFATDVRSAAKEQVESLGGKFLTIEGVKNLETKEGYAKEADKNFKNKQEELLKNSIKKNDIIICTALIPGKKAPRIISEDMVKSMQPGSIIYDLAVNQGGNSAFSEPDKVNVVNGVKVMGARNILNNLALTASNLYAKNLFNFVNNLYNKEKKGIYINKEDEIISKTLISKNW